MEILLDHIVQTVQGLEATLEDGEHQPGQDEKTQAQQGQSDEIHQAQLGAEPVDPDAGQHYHHRAAHRHADEHLEAHLDIGNVTGQTGDDGGGREFIDVGEVEGLHPVVHIVAQIPGKAGGGLGGENGRAYAEYQAAQGGEHQHKTLLPYHGHIAGGDAQVYYVCYDAGDAYLHVHLADHTQGTEQRRPNILPDAPGKL